MKKSILLFLCLAIFSYTEAQRKKSKSAAAPAPAKTTTLDDHFAPLVWRSIGPYRGGRSVAAVGVVGDPLTY